MRQSYFIEYVPNSYMSLCTDKAQQRANNRFVYDFKNGNRAASRICGELLMKYLSNRYGNLLSDFVVVFAPCSSQAKYNKRFGYVAAMLKAMNVKTANEHIHIFGERKPLHNGGSHFVNEDVFKVSVDADFFKGKNVILFDDLLTSGKTIEEFKEKIEAAGAYVEEEIFLGRTIHHDPISMRGCLQEMAEGFYDSVARQLMNMVDNSLSKLARLSMYDLQVVQGVGDCKALAILAALELAKRKTMEKGSQRPDMGSSLAIYNYLQPMIGDLQVEQAHVILMNQNFKMLKHVKLSEGGLTETAVDVRLIIKEAVQCNATIVALAHNHPSGNTKPSRQDDVLTLNVKKACEVMRLFFMDHIIVTDGAYYSYHDKGKL